MAKNSFPMPKTGSGLIPKALGLLVLFAVGALVIQHPVDAAHWLTGVIKWCGDTVNAVASFIRAAAG